MFNSNDITRHEAYRKQIVRDAEKQHLAWTAQTNSEADISQQPTPHKWLIAAVLCALLILILFLTPQSTHAQDLADPGQMMPFASANAAYRVGLYFFNQGDYERAISELTTAINGIPSEVFALNLDYAVFYWTLGDAQFMNMQYDDALASYEHFLELAGEEASEAALQYVGILRDAIGTNEMVNVALLAG